MKPIVQSIVFMRSVIRPLYASKCRADIPKSRTRGYDPDPPPPARCAGWQWRHWVAVTMGGNWGFHPMFSWKNWRPF